MAKKREKRILKVKFSEAVIPFQRSLGSSELVDRH